MAAIEITISGVLYDKQARTTRPVVLIGEASLTGLGVGGGPIYPDDKPPQQPPGIWGGGNEPFPGWGLPGGPGKPPQQPPGIWGGGNEPFPGWGLPTPPPGFPERPPEGVKPPPPGGGWGYHPDYGWGYFPKPNEPGPK